MKYNVLVTDGLDKSGADFLESSGINPIIKKVYLNELESEIAGYDGIIVRSATKLIDEKDKLGNVIRKNRVIENGANGLLKVIGRAGVGCDNVDVESASFYGVPVIIAPHGNTNAAAEFTLGLMISIARNIPQANATLESGLWVKKAFEGFELKGKTLGVIGCGRIGKRVAEIAYHGFGMKILGNDIYPIENGEIEFMDLEHLLKNSDFVSIHTTGTKKIIGEKELGLMKPSAYLINMSRGKSVDEKALSDALKERKIAGAALDVFEKEGKEGDEWKNELFNLPNFIGSSHLGASTKEAQSQTSFEIARKIAGYLNVGKIEDAANMDNLDVSKYEQEESNICRVTHDYKPGMFSKISGVFASHGINIIDMPSRVLKSEKTKKALTQVYVDAPETPKEVLNELKKIDGVERVI